MTGLDVAIRPASEADMPIMADLLTAHDSATASPPPPGAWDPYLLHLLARATVLIATIDGGEPVGFGAAVDTVRATHLADLYVAPSRLGHGIGGALLRQVLGERFPRTTFASDDPRAMALYVRAGMKPMWPTFYLSRDTAPSATPGRSDGDAAPVARDSQPEDLAELELAWTGVDRLADHRLWPKRSGGRPFVVEQDGVPLGVGHSRARTRGGGRWIHRFVCRPDADDEAVIAATLVAMEFAAVAEETTAIGACVPGPHVALRGLLEAGFSIVDRDTYLASDPGLLDATRTLVDTGIP